VWAVVADGAGRSWSISRAEHMVAVVVAVIFGQYGGPSSTSTEEAGSQIFRRISTPLGSQVVCPRIPRSGLQLDVCVGDWWRRHSCPLLLCSLFR
jgi:hypothetical protein